MKRYPLFPSPPPLLLFSLHTARRGSERLADLEYKLALTRAELAATQAECGSLRSKLESCTATSGRLSQALAVEREKYVILLLT